MQKIRGVEFQGAEFEGRRILWFPIMAILLETSEKNLFNAYYRVKDSLGGGDTIILTKTQCLDHGIPCPSNKGRRVFFQSGFEKITKGYFDQGIVDEIMEYFHEKPEFVDDMTLFVDKAMAMGKELKRLREENAKQKQVIDGLVKQIKHLGAECLLALDTANEIVGGIDI